MSRKAKTKSGLHLHLTFYGREQGRVKRYRGSLTVHTLTYLEVRRLIQKADNVKRAKRTIAQEARGGAP